MVWTEWVQKILLLFLKMDHYRSRVISASMTPSANWWNMMARPCSVVAAHRNPNRCVTAAMSRQASRTAVRSITVVMRCWKHIAPWLSVAVPMACWWPRGRWRLLDRMVSPKPCATRLHYVVAEDHGASLFVMWRIRSLALSMMPWTAKPIISKNWSGRQKKAALYKLLFYKVGQDRMVLFYIKTVYEHLRHQVRCISIGYRLVITNNLATIPWHGKRDKLLDLFRRLWTGNQIEWTPSDCPW